MQNLNLKKGLELLPIAICDYHTCYTFINYATLSPDNVCDCCVLTKIKYVK